MIISILKNPAGYSPGFFGYVIAKGDRQWRDGGYNTPSEARKAARKLARTLPSGEPLPNNQIDT